MRINVNNVAFITLQELHDILALRSLLVEDPENNDEMVMPSQFVLEDPNVPVNPTTPAHRTALAIITELNQMLQKFIVLDGMFHQKVGEDYCPTDESDEPEEEEAPPRLH